MDRRCGRRVWLRQLPALEFLNPKPGLWKAAVVLALGASIWASVPLLHRFGALCGAVTAILTMQAYLFSLTWLIGTGSGLQMLYLVAAALIFVFGRERFFLFVVLGILAVLQVVLLQIMVPHDTGLLDLAALLTTFVFTVTVNCIVSIGFLRASSQPIWASPSAIPRTTDSAIFLVTE